MEYSKPEVVSSVLAVEAIQGSCNKSGAANDSPPCPPPHTQATTAAYEADE